MRLAEGRILGVLIAISLWPALTSAQEPIDLGTLPGYTVGRARGINQRGDVVGQAAGGVNSDTGQANSDTGKIARPTKRHGNCTKRISGSVSHKGSETASDIRMKITAMALSTLAVARFRKIATGRVSVFIFVAPASVTVAPNSPTALAHVNTAAAINPSRSPRRRRRAAGPAFSIRSSVAKGLASVWLIRRSMPRMCVIR